MPCSDSSSTYRGRAARLHRRHRSSIARVGGGRAGLRILWSRTGLIRHGLHVLSLCGACECKLPGDGCGHQESVFHGDHLLISGCQRKISGCQRKTATGLQYGVGKVGFIGPGKEPSPFLLE